MAAARARTSAATARAHARIRSEVAPVAGEARRRQDLLVESGPVRVDPPAERGGVGPDLRGEGRHLVGLGQALRACRGAPDAHWTRAEERGRDRRERRPLAAQQVERCVLPAVEEERAPDDRGVGAVDAVNGPRLRKLRLAPRGAQLAGDRRRDLRGGVVAAGKGDEDARRTHAGSGAAGSWSKEGRAPRAPAETSGPPARAIPPEVGGRQARGRR
jgi:hypothetical protein